MILKPATHIWIQQCQRCRDKGSTLFSTGFTNADVQPDIYSHIHTGNNKFKIQRKNLQIKKEKETKIKTVKI